MKVKIGGSVEGFSRFGTFSANFGDLALFVRKLNFATKLHLR